MSLKKKHVAGGVITFHTPSPLSFLKSTESKGILKEGTSCASESRKTPSRRSVKIRNTRGGFRAGKRDEAWASAPPQRPKLNRLSHTTLGRLQEKLETENQEARAMVQPLLDTHNELVKELESFLRQRDAAELRRREMLHQRWTERVWTPVQKRVEEHISNRCYDEAERLRSSYTDYIQYCNTKGFVFLESYDPHEYNPFLLNSKKPHYFKLSTPALTDPLVLQSRDRIREKGTALSCETGRKYTRRQVEELLQNDLPHLAPRRISVTPRPDLPLLASPYYPASASREPLVEAGTKLWNSSRLNAIPYEITEIATPNGRCQKVGCWSSRR